MSIHDYDILLLFLWEDLFFPKCIKCVLCLIFQLSQLLMSNLTTKWWEFVVL